MFFLSVIGCGSLFIVFMYIILFFEDVIGVSEYSVMWIFVLYGCGVMFGNVVGGKLVDWKLMFLVVGIFVFFCIVLIIFMFIVKSLIVVIIMLFFWGVVVFVVMFGI